MIGQLIGEGNTAEVYAWGENEILKLFRQEFPQQGIEKEYQVSKTIEKLGLPIPKLGQMIDYEGRKGIIYERVMGDSMLNRIIMQPISNGKYSRQLAQLHYQVHQCKTDNLPGYKEELEWNIRHVDILKEEQKLAILKLLDALPEGNVLCHGDFHPGNVIMAQNKTYILDWMTAISGVAQADVARTYLLLKDAALPENIPLIQKYLVKLVRSRMAKVYLSSYLKISGLHKEDIRKWRVPLAAARLMEWIPESERKALLKMIEKAIS